MFRLSIKYSSLLVIPASLALAVLSKEFVYTLYGTQYGLAPSYLALYAINFLFVGLGSFSISNLFSGQGDTKTVLRVNLFNVALFLPIVPPLTVLYGVQGLIASLIVTGFLSAIYGLHLARRRYGLTLDGISSLKIGVASLSSTLLVYIFLRFFHLSTPLYNLAVGGGLFLTAFLIFAPLLGAIKESDINNLDEMTMGLTPIYPIARRILHLEEKILSVTSKIRLFMSHSSST